MVAILVKKRFTTKPKRNAGYKAKPKGLGIFMKSLNLWDLTLDKKK
jgi:hypothetical protein